MSISPPGSSAPPSSARIPKHFLGPHPTKSGTGAQRTASEAHAAEKDAQARVAAAQSQVRDTEREAEARMNELRDSYSRQSEEVSDRHTTSLESQKEKSYKALKDLKRSMDAELSRTRRDGERTLAETREFYRNAIYSNRRNGEQELDELKSNLGRSVSHEQKLTQMEMEQLTAANNQRVNDLIEQRDRSYAEMTDATRKEYERIKANSSETRETAEKEFQQDFQTVSSKHKSVLERLNATAARKLWELKSETSTKLAAFSDRNSDPFYQMVDVSAELHETSDAFILTAEIPEHERNHVSVSVRNNQIVLSGQRKNQERVDLEEPGRYQTTASFQSFTEAFPLDWPVDSRQVSRQYDGDFLIVTIPKKPAYASRGPHQAKRPEKVRPERPQFPENLPLSKQDPLSSAPPEPSPKGPGTKTLG